MQDLYCSSMQFAVSSCKALSARINEPYVPSHQCTILAMSVITEIAAPHRQMGIQLPVVYYNELAHCAQAGTSFITCMLRPGCRLSASCPPLLFVQQLPPGCCCAVMISATKDGVKFQTSGDVGTGNITVRQNSTADKVGCQQGSDACAAQQSLVEVGRFWH